MTLEESETIIREAVRDRYAKLAQKQAGEAACCGEDCCGSSQVALVPDESTEVAAGCGSPLSYAKIAAGQVIVDLGSGGGIDVFAASKRVGPQGRAIGIDSTPEMIWKARETAKKHDYTNVEFRLGEIEHIPLEANSADWVISNCVINLAPNKEAVFRDAYRVLKPGGRLLVSDIVAERPIPEAARKLVNGWAACITGAIEEAEYLSSLAKAGFARIQVPERKTGIDLKLTGLPSTEKLKLASLTITAEKPSGDA